MGLESSFLSWRCEGDFKGAMTVFLDVPGSIILFLWLCFRLTGPWISTLVRRRIGWNL